MSEIPDNDSASKSVSPVERALFQEKLGIVCRESGKNPVVAPIGTRASDVLSMMRERTTAGAIVVTADRKLAGIFTARDYLDKLADEDASPSEPIDVYMTCSPKTLSPRDTVGDAIQLMTVGGYRHVPVLNDDGTVFGLVSVRDVANFIAEHFPEEVYNHPPMLNQQPETQEGG